MRVLLPGHADGVAMTKQTFVAVDVFGNRFANVIATPRSWVNNGLLTVRKSEKTCEEARNQIFPAKAQRRKALPSF